MGKLTSNRMGPMNEEGLLELENRVSGRDQMSRYRIRDGLIPEVSEGS